MLFPAKPTENADFITVAAVRDSKIAENPYLIFSCCWIGNSKEELSEYGQNATENKIIRDQIKLTTNGYLGNSPVLCYGSDAYLYKLKTSPEKLYKASSEGNPIETVQEVDSKEFCYYRLNRTDKTLWYILK